MRGKIEGGRERRQRGGEGIGGGIRREGEGEGERERGRRGCRGKKEIETWREEMERDTDRRRWLWGGRGGRGRAGEGEREREKERGRRRVGRESGRMVACIPVCGAHHPRHHSLCRASSSESSRALGGPKSPHLPVSRATAAGGPRVRAFAGAAVQALPLL